MNDGRGRIESYLFPRGELVCKLLGNEFLLMEPFFLLIYQAILPFYLVFTH